MSRARDKDGLAAGAVASPDEGAEAPEPEPRWRGAPTAHSARICHEIVEDDEAWGTVDGAHGLIARALEALAEVGEVQARLTGETSEIVVVLSNDATVGELNGRFRGKPQPTNVLSFPAPAEMANLAPSKEPRALGDIVLSAQTVFGEAEQMDIPLAHHLQHLVVHGALHLLGYDHIETAEAEEMERLEREILAALGVPDPYAGSEPVDAGMAYTTTNQ